MIARVEVSDHEIADAVAAVEGEMLELLARLVEAPTTSGNEEPGQEVMERALRELLGLEPFDLASDAQALRAHPSAAPFSWDVSEKPNGAAFREVGVATNHQDDVEWHEHARATRSLEREHTIAAALEEAADPQGFVSAFLEPPLYSGAYRSGMGTLYTAVYKPGSGSVEYRWPGVAWEHSFGHFREGSRTIRLLESTAA